MERRKYLKTLGVTAVTTGVLVDACKTEKKEVATTQTAETIDRMTEEKAHEESLKNAAKFFTDDETATIVVLADIIIPKDEVSGSASDAKVADFIEFIVKDNTDFQTPMRGGLRWLDMECLKKYEK